MGRSSVAIDDEFRPDVEGLRAVAVVVVVVSVVSWAWAMPGASSKDSANRTVFVSDFIGLPPAQVNFLPVGLRVHCVNKDKAANASCLKSALSSVQEILSTAG